MPGSDLTDDCAYIAGDGDYDVEVVSEIRHQDRLEWLAQGRDEEPTDYACTAILEHEPDNPRGANTVSVSIRRVRVGYLPADAAARMIAAAEAWGFERASCEAIIEGGWYRSAEDKGDFCVRLDSNPDFVPSVSPDDARPIRAAPVLLPAPVALAAAHAPLAKYDFKSIGIGAGATVATLALIGVLWLAVQPVAGRFAARSSPPPTDVASSKGRGEPVMLVEAADLSPSLVDTRASPPSSVRPVPVAVAPSAAVRAVDVRDDPLPAPTAERALAVDAPAAAVALLAAARLERPVPVAPAAPAVVPSAAAEGAAAARHVEGNRAPALDTAPIVAIPRPRPAVHATTRTASSAHRESTRSRSHARSRVARHTRSRHSTHHRRRREPAARHRSAPTRRAAEARPSEAPPRRANTALRVPDAARMLDGLAQQWTTEAPRSLRMRRLAR